MKGGKSGGAKAGERGPRKSPSSRKKKLFPGVSFKGERGLGEKKEIFDVEGRKTLGGTAQGTLGTPYTKELNTKEKEG